MTCAVRCPLAKCMNAMFCFAQSNISAELMSNCNSARLASRIKIFILLFDSESVLKFYIVNIIHFNRSNYAMTIKLNL